MNTMKHNKHTKSYTYKVSMSINGSLLASAFWGHFSKHVFVTLTEFGGENSLVKYESIVQIGTSDAWGIFFLQLPYSDNINMIRKEKKVTLQEPKIYHEMADLDST